MSIMTRIRDFDHAIEVLDDYLRSLDYTRTSREGIREHVRTFGTLEGTVPLYLDREHYEVSTEVLVDALEPVGFYSPTWAEEPFSGHWTPNDAYRVMPPELEDDQADTIIGTDSMGGDIFLSDCLALPPISGGSADERPLPGLDPEPYEPSAEDLADYHGWLASLPDETPEIDMGDYRTIEEHEAIRSGQVTADELSQIASHGCP